MKIQFCAPEKYNLYVLGEYEFTPLHNMEKDEGISLTLREILEDVPSVFVNMRTLLLEFDKDFHKCIEERPEIETNYLKHEQYDIIFNGNYLLPESTIKIVEKTHDHKKQNDLFNTHFVKEDAVIQLKISPERCRICCSEGKTFINRIARDTYTIMECLRCIEKQEEHKKDYIKKQEFAQEGYYSNWNGYLCDDCEAYGHECRVCRQFRGHTYN
jgi:hypothetical protein